MISFIKKNLPEIILTFFVVLYSLYFSLLTINRSEKLYSHYFDLGIMHQTVHNTYKAIQTGDLSRVLELTNPHRTEKQVKRMAIHNDMFLALLAPFYFIHDGPETLLIIQTITLAIGAGFIFLLAKKILKNMKYSEWIAVVLSISYLLYPPLEKANKFDFHAVTLASTLLLAMFYYWQEKKYKVSLVYLILSILTKEQVGMTTAFFGGYVLFEEYKHNSIRIPKRFSLKKSTHTVTTELEKNVNTRFAATCIAISLIWVFVSMAFIIPMSRGGEHFASKYYNHIKERPYRVFTYPLKQSTVTYVTKLIGPVGFLPVLSPVQFLITIPELGVNLLSNNPNMRDTYFHYDSVLTPFVYISSLYGILFVYEFIKKRKKSLSTKALSIGIMVYILAFAILYSYLDSPLPYAKEADIYPWNPPQPKYYEVIAWKKILDDDQIKVSASGTLAPHFTSRQYFYDFSWKYRFADYVVIDTYEVGNGFLKEQSKPAYKQLQNDRNYIRIYEENGIAVYRKIVL